MNKWTCQHHGCIREVAGVGGGVGLRAIGWYFAVGPTIYCPAHRRDGIPGKYHDCTLEKCGTCKGQEEAERIQGMIAAAGEVG